MDDLAAELERARSLDVGELADAIETIGFSCTRCGACCRGHGDDHTATVFPDEVREIAGESYDWRDVARPMPFGLDGEGEAASSADRASGDDGAPGNLETLSGETFEWALQTDACGDCAFYEDEGLDGSGLDGGESTAGVGSDVGVGSDAGSGPDTNAGAGTCTVYWDRPLICQTYPFSVELGGSEPMGGVVERVGPVRAHECEGLGREIERGEAEDLAWTVKERAIREVEEMIAVRDAYEPADPGPGEVVVHDSEGAKRIDGTPYRG